MDSGYLPNGFTVSASIDFDSPFSVVEERYCRAYFYAPLGVTSHYGPWQVRGTVWCRLVVQGVCFGLQCLVLPNDTISVEALIGRTAAPHLSPFL